MTNILFNLLVLFLFFSCGNPQKQKNSSKNLLKNNSIVLSPQQFIPELPAKLNEISGLLIYDDLFWGFNDSGGKNKIYGFNKSGEIKKEIEFENAKNKDWESITQDEKNIYVGDFGNNSGGRDNLRIFKIKKKDIKKDKEQKVESKKINLIYENQVRFNYFNNTTPFDCEAMVEFNGNLYMFSKNWAERTTIVYKLPTKKGEYYIHPIDTFDVKGLISGADISPDKNQLALVGYEKNRSFIWLFSNFPEDNFFEGKNQHFKLEGLNDAQTEGICFYGNDSLLVSCERTKSFKQQVFLFDLVEIKDGAH